MSLFREATHRDTILFLNGIRPSTIEAVDTYRSRYDKKVNVLILVDQMKKKTVESLNAVKSSGNRTTIISCNLDSPVEIKKTLAPYIDRLLAVSSQFENSVPALQKVLPHVPYLNGPTEESLDWATNKIKMRQMLRAHNPAISPKFAVIEEPNEAAIIQIEKTVGYPCVVKPAGLAASMLVSIVYYREELEEVLKATFTKINAVYKKKLGRGAPKVLVEEMMEGVMYSIDGYVNDRGNIYLNPPVYIKLGREIGFDDFFGYMQTTPTKLRNNQIEQANHVATESIKALGLRSTTAHVELMKTAEGWKIIELAPRMGGYRHTLYNWSFGINHILNDILIRIPQKPVIPKKTKGYTAAFKLFARKEGKLDTIKGLKKLRELESYVGATIMKKKGDMCLYAKNGGSVVIEITLYNKERARLQADIRRMEKSVEIVVEQKGKRK
jgi:biotin carboxylase